MHLEGKGLLRAKPTLFSLFMELPDWICRALVKLLHKMAWMRERNIGWVSEEFGRFHI